MSAAKKTKTLELTLTVTGTADGEWHAELKQGSTFLARNLAVGRQIALAGGRPDPVREPAAPSPSPRCAPGPDQPACACPGPAASSSSQPEFKRCDLR